MQHLDFDFYIMRRWLGSAEIGKQHVVSFLVASGKPFKSRLLLSVQVKDILSFCDRNFVAVLFIQIYGAKMFFCGYTVFITVSIDVNPAIELSPVETGAICII